MTEGITDRLAAAATQAVAVKSHPSTSPPAPREWLDRLARIGDRSGDFLPLGSQHWALFVDRAPTLIVSFETTDEAMSRPGQMPLAHAIAAAHGWSHLCLLAQGETWWRDPAVWRYFDRLIDDGFFEDFDHVLFTGSGIGGYAACAFSVAAPGATVLAFAPRATMQTALTGWDDRHPAARRLDFTSRYGYAPDMVEAAERVFLVLDPYEPRDLAHAALFRMPWVTRLLTPCAGSDPASLLAGMGLIRPLIEAACTGTLTPATFAELWRKRRESPCYLRRLLARTEAKGQVLRAEVICYSVAARMQLPYFRRRPPETGSGTAPGPVSDLRQSRRSAVPGDTRRA